MLAAPLHLNYCCARRSTAHLAGLAAPARAGTLFWEWAVDTLQERDGLTVLANDTTFVNIVVPSLREAQTYASPRLPGCQPIAPKPTAAPVQVGIRGQYVIPSCALHAFKTLDSHPGFAKVAAHPCKPARRSLQTGAQWC